MHHGILEAGDKVKGHLRAVFTQVINARALHSLAPSSTLLGLRRKFTPTHMVEHGGLKSGKTEIQRITLHLDVTKIHRRRISRTGELINDRTAGISESKQSRNLVEGFAGSVIPRAAELRIIKIQHGGAGGGSKGSDIE